MIENDARIKVEYSETENIELKWQEVSVIGDADSIYDKGFSEGYNKGYEAGFGEGNAIGYGEGFRKGKEEGLAQRQYETWTLTLADGSTVEKEIALL